MEITSLVPLFVICSLQLTTAHLVVTRVKFFREAAESSVASKYTTFDGLRGFAALSVFFAHALMYYFYFNTGEWKVPYSAYNGFLGSAAVTCFFMITGFLFWSKAISEKVKIKSFYTRRVLRVYPLYLFSLVCIIFIALALSNFSLKIGLSRFLYEVLRWSTCGLFNFPFITGIVASPPINTINTIPINAGIQWTLIYEIQFYLVLPLLAIFSKLSRFLLLFAFFLILNQLLAIQSVTVMVNFLFGMVAAYIFRRYRLERILSHWLFSVLIVFLLFLASFLVANKLAFYVVIFAVFIIATYGNSFFGLLTLNASRYLGIISYSVYLLHGIALFSFLKAVDFVYPIEKINPIYYWILVALCGLTLIFLCGLTYRFVEYPFLNRKNLKFLQKEA
ncbi:MAG: acyltransferase family protein [Leptolyngbya sp. BL-A-14]